MSLSDVMLQNFMPRNILDSDDDGDSWSLGGRSSGGSSLSGDSHSSTNGSPSYKSKMDAHQDFRLFGDYFGLSNLLNNIKISEDNPLLYGTQKNLALLQKAHRLGWENEASDQDAAISPVMDSYCYDNNNYINELDSYSRDRSVSEPACKQLPPPSMRLSKDLRDHIISGAYQQQFNNRLSGKYPQQGMPMNPSLSMSAPQSMSMLPVGAQNGPTPRTQPGIQVCVFCRNNKESESVYTSHVLKDSEGRTVCPILRAYTCPICKANGDSSHTIKYCPENQNARMMQLAGQHQPFGQGNGFRNHQPPRSFRPPLPNPMQLNANLAQHAGGKVRP